MSIEKERMYKRDKKPEKFYALCEKNYETHMKNLEEDYKRLTDSGVPKKYIFVVQANRGDQDKHGDIFSYQDKERLERTLHWVRDHCNRCFLPDVYECLCVDIRDTPSVREYISDSYFPDDLINKMIDS